MPAPVYRCLACGREWREKHRAEWCCDRDVERLMCEPPHRDKPIVKETRNEPVHSNGE